MEEIPTLKALVQRLDKKPFAVAGINTDEGTSEALARKLAAKGVTWRQALDGTEGPIAAAWNVSSFPTIVVLDAKGVIRSLDTPAGPELDKLVNELVAETEKTVAPEKK